MFKNFFKKAAPPPPPPPLTAERVRMLAMQGGSWDTKYDLLKDCRAAFDAGNPALLQSFLMSYLEFKRGGNSIDNIEHQGLDDGLKNLVAAPLMLLLERQADPQAALLSLTDPMSVYYRQLTLDITLRHACSRNSWLTVPQLIKAGADVNTGHGRPLYTAIINNHPRMIDMLLAAGADPAIATEHVSDKDIEKFNTAVAAGRQRAKDAPKEAVIDQPSPIIAPVEKTIIRKRTPGI